MSNLTNDPHIEILHHGATHGVTGSCHELKIDNKFSILIDCGLFQGAETSADRLAHFEQLQINFPIEKVVALIVTHVHIDHVGRIPYLLAAGFQGPIICSKASALLLPEVLKDAVKIGFTRNKHDIERFIELIEQRIIALDYEKWFSINPSVTVDSPHQLSIKLKNAGHILGSAYIECLVRHHRNKQRITFSGDLGSSHTPLLKAPQSPYSTDVLILESTYGNRTHPDRSKRQKQLEKIISTALADQGSVLIPAFSIGRTQEILYELALIIAQNKTQKINRELAWDELEIIIDSPLAARFNEKYRQLRRFWDKQAKHHLQRGIKPLSFEQLITIDSHQQHLDTVNYLQKTKRPAVVIAASGMCSGGRIVNYLKKMISEPRHNIVFAGYQAEGTLGRKIQQYSQQSGYGYVLIDGKKQHVRAKVHTLTAYSAHADQTNLLSFVKKMRLLPREIRLVHGSLEAKQALKQKLEKLFIKKRHRGEITIPG